MMTAALLAMLFFTTADKHIELDGTVTFRRRADPYYFIVDDVGNAWRVAETNAQISVRAGDRVRISGVVPKHVAQWRIENATSVKTGTGELPPVRNLTIAEMYAHAHSESDWYGELVSVAGEIIDINRRKSYTQILIGAQHQNVQIALPINWSRTLPEGLVRGGVVRVQGIGVYTPVCAPDGRTVARLDDFCVLPARLEDLQIIGTAPFWTPSRVAMLCGGLVLLMLAPLWWLQRKRRIDRALADGVRRERLRLTGALHDNFQQLLAGCMFLLGAAQGKIEKGETDAAKAQLARLRGSLNHTQSELRAALWGLTEESEGPSSLTELFKYAASRMPQWDGRVNFTLRGRERSVMRPVSGALLLILLEAVGNALRHGRASRVDVVVDFTETSLIFGVTDNGCGFVPDRALSHSGRFGLQNMRKHAEGIGGAFSLASAPGNGTTITIRIPL